jgi:hypothetical protein
MDGYEEADRVVLASFLIYFQAIRDGWLAFVFKQRVPIFFRKKHYKSV